MGHFTKASLNRRGKGCGVPLNAVGKLAAIRLKDIFQLGEVVRNRDIDLAAAAQNIGFEVGEATIQRLTQRAALNNDGLFE